MEDNVRKLEREVEQTTASLNRNFQLIETELTKKVQDTKERAIEKMEDIKESFNLKKQVEKHPTQMVGGAVVTGLIVGAFVSGGSRKSSRRGQELTDHDVTASHQFAEEIAPSIPSRPREKSSTAMDRVFSEFRDEIDLAKKIIMGVVFTKAGEALGKKIPQWNPVIQEIVGGASKKLGSDPAANL